MRLARLVIALIASLFPLLFVTAASAYDQRTRWFTIRVQSPTDASKHLFLTQTSSGLRLEWYRSGDITQMWALVYPEYPAGPVVDGGGGDPFSAIADCVANVLDGGCSFQGGKGSIKAKLVNRWSKRCLAVGGTKATTNDCDNAGSAKTFQTIEFFRHTFGNGSGNYTSLSTSKGNCLAGNHQETYADVIGVRALPCGKHLSKWYVNFTPDLVADKTCRTDWMWVLCY